MICALPGPHHPYMLTLAAYPRAPPFSVDVLLVLLCYNSSSPCQPGLIFWDVANTRCAAARSRFTCAGRQADAAQSVKQHSRHTQTAKRAASTTQSSSSQAAGRVGWGPWGG
jgi:hypothetical protein